MSLYNTLGSIICRNFRQRICLDQLYFVSISFIVLFVAVVKCTYESLASNMFACMKIWMGIIWTSLYSLTWWILMGQALCYLIIYCLCIGFWWYIDTIVYRHIDYMYVIHCMHVRLVFFFSFHFFSIFPPFWCCRGGKGKRREKKLSHLAC